jgi:hypothetical protein
VVEKTTTTEGRRLTNYNDGKKRKGILVHRVRGGGRELKLACGGWSGGGRGGEAQIIRLYRNSGTTSIMPLLDNKKCLLPANMVNNTQLYSTCVM